MVVVQGNILDVYNLLPLKILWDFDVVCLNLPLSGRNFRWFELIIL
jgi:hypothetical protein